MNAKAKVCMISCTHPLYDDRIYWKEALSLKKQGYDVYHIGIGRENKEFISEHEIKLILVRRIKHFKNSAIDKLYHYLIPGKNVYKKILKIAADLKADVYHLHDLQINRIGRKLKNLSHNPKMIYDVHEPFPEMIRHFRKRSPLMKIIKWIYSLYVYQWELKCSKNYDYIIATEEIVYNRFKNYLKKDNIGIIYNYTDLNSKYRNIPHTKKEFDAIYCGSITIFRGVLQIIETARIAKLKSRKLKFLILGPVWEKGLREKINSLIKEYRLADYVILKDSVPYNKIQAFYNKSKIGLAVFLDNPITRIILPIKIFEYMAFGLPIVCSNFGHLLKYTEENNTGIPVNPQNTEEIYNAVVKILDNKSVYEKYKNNCLKASKEKYDWSLMDKKLNNIYSGVLNQREVDNY
jgi:glycosyltransferase involved in cell wall biosynthesis